jgi:hypothetical protein
LSGNYLFRAAESYGSAKAFAAIKSFHAAGCCYVGAVGVTCSKALTTGGEEITLDARSDLYPTKSI